MNCRAIRGRIDIYKHIDAGRVPETESVLLRSLRDSIKILARNPNVHIRSEASLLRIPLENVDENAHATHYAVRNAGGAKSCVKAPQSLKQLFHVNIVGGSG